MALKFKSLKRGIYTSPQSGTEEFERYIIENNEDLGNFLNKFAYLKKISSSFNIIKNWKDDLKEGRIIIVTDEHPASGLPTYCYENTTGDTHPSCYNRVRILT